jgi:hypothetical protein
MHLIETMAYFGERPRTGIGKKLEAQQPIEVWKVNAGMDWQIKASEVRYIAGGTTVGVINAFPENSPVRGSRRRAFRVRRYWSADQASDGRGGR